MNSSIMRAIYFTRYCRISTLLVVGFVWPEPCSSAAGQNILSYVTAFVERGFEVHFASAALKTSDSFDLSGIGVHEHQVKLNCSSFHADVEQICPDIVIFDRYLSEEQFGWRVSQAAPNAAKVLDCEDLHFLRLARQAAYKSGKNLNQTALDLSALQTDTAKREIAAIYRCDLSILLSPFEQSLLIEQFGVPPDILLNVRFILPSNISKPPQLGFEQRIDMLTIGNFRHPPNWDAVLQLKQQYWPAIRKQLPKVNCHIYGAYLPPKAKALENKQQGFLVHGFAPNALQVVSQARLLLAPLHFGAGLKGKLVDAMQVGTPSITTSIGAEGIAEENQWPGAIGNQVDSFVEQAINLYNNAEEWQLQSERAKTLLAHNFNRDALTNTLMTRIDDLLENLTAHRQTHFISQVLNHHTTLSTKYMSQWIEAKNRHL